MVANPCEIESCWKPCDIPMARSFLRLGCCASVEEVTAKRNTNAPTTADVFIQETSQKSSHPPEAHATALQTFRTRRRVYAAGCMLSCSNRFQSSLTWMSFPLMWFDRSEARKTASWIWRSAEAP